MDCLRDGCTKQRRKAMEMGRFDEVINRKGTDSLKYDFAKEYGVPEDAIPLWVADMDFRAPQAVIDAVRERAAHGIFGYTEVKDEYFQAVAGWYAAHFDFHAEKEWLVKTPGVVFAISHALRAFTKEGDAVLIQQPVYYPFASTVLDNHRVLVNNELRYVNGAYEIDFEDFEKKITEQKVKLFILCSPHNPVGRVWTREELKRLGDICTAHDVIVISDEIHCDFTYEGYPHTVYANLGSPYAEQCVICTAPSKTFNLAGLQISNIFIPNEKLRNAFRQQIRITGYEEMNTLGLTACAAAYRYGGEWLEELKQYLKKNLEYVRKFLNEELPQIRLVEPEGTYVIWLDCAGLGLSGEDLDLFMKEKAKLWLDGGMMFGERSGQFVRINMTCPASVLKKALEQLKAALEKGGLMG